MKPALYKILVDPVHKKSFGLRGQAPKNDDVASATLVADDGAEYGISSGIPRLVTTTDEGQRQTERSFAFKWQKRAAYENPRATEFQLNWLPAKYGFRSVADWAGFYSSRRRILDLGCGSGASSGLWLDSQHWSGDAMWVGVDISTAVDLAQDRLGHIPNTHFVQADALRLPFRSGAFDTIVAEGVLHHTPSTRLAMLAAADLLESGGECHFYVYRRKGPIREFTDDHLRQAIAGLSDEQAWEAMQPLTQLGQALSDLKVQVDVPDVPLLGISAGSYDVQRLIYWNFAKLFWNDETSFEYNALVNFDWYHPQYAHRQTEQEVREWCAEADLSVKWLHTEESGYSVIGVKAG